MAFTDLHEYIEDMFGLLVGQTYGLVNDSGAGFLVSQAPHEKAADMRERRARDPLLRDKQRAYDRNPARKLARNQKLKEKRAEMKTNDPEAYQKLLEAERTKKNRLRSQKRATNGLH